MLTFNNYIMVAGVVSHFVAIGLILLLICNKLTEKAIKQHKRQYAKNYCRIMLKNNLKEV